MRIHLKDIRAISQCPAYYTFLKDSPKKPSSTPLQVARRVIKRGYLNAAETSFRLAWKSVTDQVHAEIFETIDMDDQDQRAQATKMSEYTLIFLRHWYQDMYLAEEAVGYADVELSTEVNGDVVTATAPVIKFGKELSVLRISPVEYIASQLYNDIGMRGLLWFVSEALESESITGQHLTMGPQGGMVLTETRVDREANRRVRKAILQAISMIKGGISFPSVTEKCVTCPFKRRCRL